MRTCVLYTQLITHTHTRTYTHTHIYIYIYTHTRVYTPERSLIVGLHYNSQFALSLSLFPSLYLSLCLCIYTQCITTRGSCVSKSVCIYRVVLLADEMFRSVSFRVYICFFFFPLSNHTHTHTFTHTQRHSSVFSVIRLFLLLYPLQSHTHTHTRIYIHTHSGVWFGLLFFFLL
jgi:hypothetical protein